MLQEVTATGAHLRLCLQERTSQAKAQNRAVKDL
jgi:hypothetical protein